VFYPIFHSFSRERGYNSAHNLLPTVTLLGLREAQGSLTHGLFPA